MWKDWHLAMVEELPKLSMRVEQIALLPGQLEHSLNIIIGWNKVNKPHISGITPSSSLVISLFTYIAFKTKKHMQGKTDHRYAFMLA